MVFSNCLESQMTQNYTANSSRHLYELRRQRHRPLNSYSSACNPVSPMGSNAVTAMAVKKNTALIILF